MRFYSTTDATANFDPTFTYRVNLTFLLLSQQNLVVEFPYKLKCQQDLYTITYNSSVANSQSYYYNDTSLVFEYEIQGFGTNT